MSEKEKSQYERIKHTDYTDCKCAEWLHYDAKNGCLIHRTNENKPMKIAYYEFK